MDRDTLGQRNTSCGCYIVLVCRDAFCGGGCYHRFWFTSDVPYRSTNRFGSKQDFRVFRRILQPHGADYDSPRRPTSISSKACCPTGSTHGGLQPNKHGVLPVR